MSENGSSIVPAGHLSAMPALIRPVASTLDLIEAHKQNVEIITQVLVRDRDYGEIPGTGRPTLYKAGAERLLTAFGCYSMAHIIEFEVNHDQVNSYDLVKWEAVKQRPSDKEVERLKAEGRGRFRKSDGGWVWQECTIEAGTSLGFYRYVIRCDIIHRESGAIISSGIGACSTMESKYIRSPRDYENTVIKMGKKRAMVDATLGAFGLSDRFTQDVEDMPHLAAAANEEAPAKNSANADHEMAKLFLKQITDNKNELVDPLRAHAKNVQIHFLDLAFEAMQNGAKNMSEVMAYVQDGEQAHHAPSPEEIEELAKRTIPPKPEEAPPKQSNARDMEKGAVEWLQSIGLKTAEERKPFQEYCMGSKVSWAKTALASKFAGVQDIQTLMVIAQSPKETIKDYEKFLATQPTVLDVPAHGHGG